MSLKGLRGFSRRSFLIHSVATAGTVAVLGACAPKATEAPAPTKPPEEPAKVAQPEPTKATTPEAVKAAAEPTKIKMLHWQSQEGEQKAWDSYYAAFAEKNPDIRVEQEVVVHAHYSERVLTYAAAGDTADVMQIDGNWRGFQQAGAMLDITPYVDLWPGDLRGETPKTSINDYNYSVIRQKFSQFADGQFGWPFVCMVYFDYLNLELFEKHGVDIPEPGWTWDDFRATIKALTDSGANEFGSEYFVPYGDDTRNAIKQNGGSWYDPEEGWNLWWRPECVEAIMWLAELAQKDKSMVPPEASGTTFQSGGVSFTTGKVAVSYMGSWAIGGRSSTWPFQWGTVPEKRGKAGGAQMMISNGLGVPKHAKHPDEGARFIAWMCGPEGQMMMAKNNQLPMLAKVAEEHAYREIDQQWRERIFPLIVSPETYNLPYFGPSSGAPRTFDYIYAIYNGQVPLTKEAITEEMVKLSKELDAAWVRGMKETFNIDLTAPPVPR
jgi:ABC-type glycerol-3-phosphate transport system substrate-binding protein